MQDIENSVGSVNVANPFGDMNTEKLDYSLIEATMESFTTGSLTPIIKEELRLKIQATRLASGKAELPKPIFREPEKVQLTPEEEERRTKRKERNRVAALKCRNKKKQQKKCMFTVQKELEKRNMELKKQLSDLTDQREQLVSLLTQNNMNIPTQTHVDIQTQINVNSDCLGDACTTAQYQDTKPPATCPSVSPVPSTSNSSFIDQFQSLDYSAIGCYDQEYTKCEPTDELKHSDTMPLLDSLDSHLFLPVPVGEEEAMVPGCGDAPLMGATSPSLFGDFWY